MKAYERTQEELKDLDAENPFPVSANDSKTVQKTANFPRVTAIEKGGTKCC